MKKKFVRFWEKKKGPAKQERGPEGKPRHGAEAKRERGPERNRERDAVKPERAPEVKREQSTGRTERSNTRRPNDRSAGRPERDGRRRSWGPARGVSRDDERVAKREPGRRPGHGAAPRTPEDRRRPRFSREVRVLYEDDAVIALDKPAGLLAVPIKGSDVESALSLVQAEMKEKRQRAFVVHRIDRFATGVLLFAKTSRDRDALVKQFLAHTPTRQYLVVVRGRVKNQSGMLVHFFKRQGMHQKETSAKDPKAARAELRYSVEQEFADATLVRVDLVTGLQNQIRAQFSAIGHPVIGDRKYHPEESSERRIDRVALHAAYLEFVHPRTREKISVESKVPGDFEHLVKVLARRRVP